MDSVHPKTFPLVILHGWNSAVLNERARAWLTQHEPGARLRPVAGLTGCKTSAAYTVVDLASSSTPAERASAMAYVREVGKLQHATLVHHMFLVYDMHLVNSRCFQNLGFSRVLGTTSKVGALSASIHSSAVFVRVAGAVEVPAQMTSLAQAAVAGQCVLAARKFAHEALKTCLEPHAAFLALMEAAAPVDRETVRELADIEHVSHLVTRPAHAIELAALLVAGVHTLA
jgi:hypothetical protein